MGCYVKNIIGNEDVVSDFKELIPDAAIRRRMSRILRMAVTTAVTCCGDIASMHSMDSIVTATGYGCLADSERFLRNMIQNNEEQLNPTPFIQSTFNTVGGLIALLSKNHAENITYVNRSHSFEDALLDAYLQLADKEGKKILLGTFDEITESSHLLLERLGLFRNGQRNGEGAVFMELTSDYSESCKIEIERIEFSNTILSKEECFARFARSKEDHIFYNKFMEQGIYPTVSARLFYECTKNLQKGETMILCNNYLGMGSSIILSKGV